ncbi:MAG: DnaB-like helicase C-terminal domain-containing protein [Pirellulaceae bacterium]
MEAQQVKLAATGRWLEILDGVAGIPRSILDRKGHPCPQCGGADRFGLVNIQTGAVICRKCFNSRNGDGLSAVAWMRNCSFPEAVKLVADYLGLTDGASSTPPRSATPPASGKPHQTWPSAAAAIEAIERGKLGKATKRWTYRDAGAEPLAVVLRWDRPDGKEIRQLSRRGDSWVAKGLEKDRPIYNAPMVASGEGRVYVVEGEKCCDALESIELLPTTSIGGSQAPGKTDWSLLAGRDVAILPDNDDPGRKYAQAVAKLLTVLTPPATVRIVELPGSPAKGDVADWLDDHDATEPESLRERLEAMADAAPLWNPADATPEPGGAKRVEKRQAISDRIKTHGKGPIPRIKLGIPGLDAALGGGIAFQSFTVFAALSSHGKSAFGLQVCHRAEAAGVSTAFISLEMSIEELSDRSLSYASSVQKANWHQAVERLEHDTRAQFGHNARGFLIEDVSSLAEVKREAEWAFQSGCQLVVIDYLQLVGATDPGSDINARMAKVSTTCKQLAKAHNGVVLGLCQFSKRVEGKKPLAPSMFDIDYGSSITRDADVILGGIWPHKIDDKARPNDYRVFLLKNRNGEANSVCSIDFTPPRQKFEDAAQEAADESDEESYHDAF